MLLDIVDTHRLLCFSRWCPAKFTAHYDLDLGATRDIPASASLKAIIYNKNKFLTFFFKSYS